MRKLANITSFGLLALLTVAMPSAAVAQITEDGLLHEAVGAPDNWHLSGSVRARFEAIDGQFREDAVNRDQVLALRTTLFAEYDAGPGRCGLVRNSTTPAPISSGADRRSGPML
ncbi:hypothetical protein [Sphingomonas sp. Leaf23]|uniref:hypothetical protein n=1 Tax=Sphingomonas sp. Leaf23 TaxID=1735689 RepID=UPI0012E2774D|nr:hypothetical protein [Sphingomonas sp. Leaf23]